MIFLANIQRMGNRALEYPGRSERSALSRLSTTASMILSSQVVTTRIATMNAQVNDSTPHGDNSKE
jgi:hypothetical protein